MNTPKSPPDDPPLLLGIIATVLIALVIVGTLALGCPREERPQPLPNSPVRLVPVPDPMFRDRAP